MCDDLAVSAEPSRTALFSGAGLSFGLPSGLPLGAGLRNTVLELCHEEASVLAGGVATPAQLRSLTGSDYKLEVVLSRVVGTVGPSALEVLASLDIALPNEAQMLSALHLAQGGTHITVNLDEGVELAYGLLTGRRNPPAGTDPLLVDALRQWRAVVPAAAPPLTVVASVSEFSAWAAHRNRPALLKIHGSVRRAGSAVQLVDPVVVDETEFSGLASNRAVALDLLTSAQTVLVTGYSGLDIDVYDLLMKQLSGPTVRWAAPDVLPQVRNDVRALPGAAIVDGRPAGLADVAIRDLFGWFTLPPWPAVAAPGESYDQRLLRWAEEFRRSAEPGARAEAYAWLLADIGQYDAAREILRVLSGRHPRNVRSRNRIADVLYDSHGRGDRRKAARMWIGIALGRTATRAQRAYALTRFGEVFRGPATRGPLPVRLTAAIPAAAGPAAALVLTRNGKSEPHEAARALSSLSGLGLRLLEGMPPQLLFAAGQLTRKLADVAASAGRRAQTLEPTGNRLLFIRQQRAEITVMACLLRGTGVPGNVADELTAVLTAYQRAGDKRGEANAAAALSLVAIAAGTESSARGHLDDAERLYAESRPGQPPDPSGIALVVRRRRLARHLGMSV